MLQEIEGMGYKDKLKEHGMLTGDTTCLVSCIKENYKEDGQEIFSMFSK